MVCVQKFLATTCEFPFWAWKGNKSFPSFSFCFWLLDLCGFTPVALWAAGRQAVPVGTLRTCALLVYGGVEARVPADSRACWPTGQANLSCGFQLLQWGNQSLISIWEMKTRLCCGSRKRPPPHAVPWEEHHSHLIHLTHSSPISVRCHFFPQRHYWQQRRRCRLRLWGTHPFIHSSNLGLCLL